MLSPLMVLNILIVGISLAGASVAFFYGWATRGWQWTVLFVVTSIGLAGYAASNAVLQATSDPQIAVDSFRILDLSACLVLYSMPGLYRHLVDQRRTWLDHFWEFLFVLLALVTLRPMGYWDTLTAMEPVNLGWLGVFHQPVGRMLPIRAGIQLAAIGLMIHCILIAWRGRKTHRIVVRWLLLLPISLIAVVLYHAGIFYAWWKGPMAGAYFGATQYLILTAAIFVRERQNTVERLQLFESLREREAKLSALTNFSIGFAGLLDPQGCVVLANQASLDAVGLSAAEVLGRPFAETPWWTHDAKQQDRLRIAIANAANGQPDRFQATHRTARGDEIAVDFSLTPYRNPQGELQYLIAEGRDISALVKFQERLRDGSRLEAVGQLAGGVAHDFNNVLGGIMSATELALLKAEKKEDVRHHLTMILRSAGRAADLTRNLLSFSRRGKSQNLPFSLNSVVRDTIAVLERTLGPAIRIESRLDAAPDLVMGDPTEIQSALMNLCINARDAMPKGGQLSLRTRREVIDLAHTERLPQTVRPGEYLALAVADSGEGIPPELRTRIFEPFFTTKPAGRGTGLGLAAVLGAVEAHHGAMDLVSAVNQGSTFTLYLPAYQPPAGAVPVPTTPVPDALIRPGRGRAVVVDDEAMVRELTAEMLRHVGFEVQTFRNPLDARQSLAADQDLNLVVMDLAMPQLDGVSLYREVRQDHPHLAIIIATGFAGGSLNDLDDPCLTTLAKPFRLDQLSAALAQLKI